MEDADAGERGEAAKAAPAGEDKRAQKPLPAGKSAAGKKSKPAATPGKTPEPPRGGDASGDDASGDDDGSGGGEVVRLDRFRKK
jgi:hypothetical protein